MSEAELFRINLNQNLWVLFVSYIAVGFSVFWRSTGHWIPWYVWWGIVLFAGASTLSVTVTMVCYTWNYCRTKISRKSATPNPR